MRGDVPPETRDAIRRWMRSVLSEKNWTANRWAKLAGTSPTNITRFLNPASTIVPSSDTISKLAMVAGSLPELGSAVPSTPVHMVPLRSWASLGRARFKPIGHVPTTMAASSEAFAVNCESDALDLGGVSVGDTLICEPPRLYKPAKGRICLMKIASRVHLGIYAPPVLMPKSTNPQHIALPIENSDVLGVAVSIIRSLA